MNSIDIPGFKTLIKLLYQNDKRHLAFEVLDFLYEKANSLIEYDVIGEMSLKSEHRDLYLKCAEKCYAIAHTTSQKYAARLNLIKAYNTMNYPEKALHHIQIQLELTPNDFEIMCLKAANISLLGKKEEAEQIIYDLLKKYPEKEKDLESMLSGKYLREGQLVRGISSFIETYKPKHKLFEDQLKMKRWNGICYPGKIIYIDGEGGIGDEIINIRFFENIKKMGMSPILYTSSSDFYKQINDVFKRHDIEILTEHYSIDNKQFWLPMMSLPVVLNLSEDDLWKGTYLKPLNNAKNKINSNKFKIGIKCSGNPYFSQDEYRKVPLELMLKYLPKDAEIYYIDKETNNHEGIINLSDKIESWEDTLDFINQMDCIVSSCTSLVHAAGAIGKTTFVAVPIAEYYIWTSSRKDNSTPWYGDNFYVYKQTELRDWNKPLFEISKQVKELMNAKA